MRRLYTSFSIFILLLAITTIAVAILSINRIKFEAAQILVSGAREALIVGDSRTAIMTLSKSVPVLFKDISFQGISGEIQFSLKTGIEHIGVFPLNIDIPVYQDANNKSKFGTLRFIYGVDEYVTTILLFLVVEFVLAGFAFKREKKLILKEVSLSLESATISAREQIAHQVAHDIRSPLTSLNVIIGKLQPHLSNENDVLQAIANRINGIADDLLIKNKAKNSDRISTEMGFDLRKNIEELVREKEILYKDVGFKLHLEEAQRINVEIVEFQRVMSNLLDNAVESLQEMKIVEVTLRRSLEGVVISITDHGSGIPPEILEKIGKTKISSKGERGNGLGLLSAFKKIEEWGGEINIYSKVSVGTNIVLRIPSLKS
ncbi:MAG: sensor histidine kinase [Bdellovibrio sp.]